MDISWAALSSADQQLFLVLNGIHHPVTDFLFKWITYKYTWVPLYLFLIVAISRAYKREAFAIIILSILALILADYITSGIMKLYFARFRPCHDPFIGDIVHNITGCGGQFGFASSHASTSFALTSAFYFFTRDRIPWIKWLFVWAAIYAYSRVAVGVHYPGDILVGALVGYITGTVFVFVYRYFRKSLL